MGLSIEEKTQSLALTAGIGVGAAVFTSDGFLVVGRRNVTTNMFPGWWSYFGGCVDSIAETAGEAMCREIFEELGVDRNQIASVRFMSLWNQGSQQAWAPARMFAARLAVSAEEV